VTSTTTRKSSGPIVFVVIAVLLAVGVYAVKSGRLGTGQRPKYSTETIRLQARWDLGVFAYISWNTGQGLKSQPIAGLPTTVVGQPYYEWDSGDLPYDGHSTVTITVSPRSTGSSPSAQIVRGKLIVRPFIASFVLAKDPAKYYKTTATYKP
jgi:hypothetical protein